MLPSSLLNPKLFKFSRDLLVECVPPEPPEELPPDDVIVRMPPYSPIGLTLLRVGPLWALPPWLSEPLELTSFRTGPLWPVLPCPVPAPFPPPVPLAPSVSTVIGMTPVSSEDSDPCDPPAPQWP